jgi:alpha-tubulin suppressor-like RCC1 family protein
MRRPILSAVLFIAFVGTLLGCGREAGFSEPVLMTQGAHGSPNADIAIFDPNAFKDITAGGAFTCAVRNTGTTYCWGINDKMQVGTLSGNCTIGFACVTRPTVVLKRLYGPDSIKAADIDAGSNHTCIRDSAAAAWCWGSGSDGQNGQGGGNFGPIEAVPVAGGLKFESIAAGGNSSCGTSKNVVFCWGAREDFKPSTASPVMVSSNASFPWVAVGHRSGCVPQTSIKSGAISMACWGMNGMGQFALPGSGTAVPFAQLSGFGAGVVGISMSEDFTCVEMSNGTVACAGNNRYGQIGLDPTMTIATSKPHTIGNGMQLHGVTTGVAHACALDAFNLAWCWGLGTGGQLGTGNFDSSTEPRRVATRLSFSRLAAGSQHTCGIGLDNRIYCWGRNDFGQLGVGGSGGGWTALPMQTLEPTS